MATNAGQLKVGSFARSERMVKWNEVIRIERSLGDKARFIGKAIFPFPIPVTTTPFPLEGRVQRPAP